LRVGRLCSVMPVAFQRLHMQAYHLIKIPRTKVPGI
jgi:hypothetical protein